MRRRMTPNLGDTGEDTGRKSENHARGVTAARTKSNGKLETESPAPSPPWNLLYRQRDDSWTASFSNKIRHVGQS